MDTPERIAPPSDLTAFTEIIDVRSSSEFAEDHLPGAINLPVLDDDQRHQVGSLYKKDQLAARLLGAQHVTANIQGHLRDHFSQKEREYAPLVYCWRGGMRSGSLATILRSIGWRVRILDGGYQDWRRFLITDLEALLPKFNLVVLAGLTGVGKTHLLTALAEKGAQVLDLEDLAQHRGSLLGLAPATTQPSQKLFESRLWHRLTQLDPEKPVFTEAESNRIGRCQCPSPLWLQLAHARVVTVSLPLEARARLLRNDYDHFIKDPETLKPLLDRLRPHCGNQRIDHWFQLIEKKDWPPFLADILEYHYDQAYRPPGHEKSNYPAPTHHLDLPDENQESLNQAAETLIKKIIRENDR